MDLQVEAQKLVERLLTNFRKICVSRVNPDLVSNVVVSCYGSESKLSEVANISIPASRTIVIKPYDSSIIEDIHRDLKIQKPEFSPVVNGDCLKIILNPPTEETRKKAIKDAKNYLEQSKIGVRNLRKLHMDDLKKQEISEDEKKRLTQQLESEVKRINEMLDHEFEGKMKELLTI